MRSKTLYSALRIIGFMLLVSSALLSQTGTGSGRIRGTVTDSEGNPLKGVKIVATFKNEISFEATTDEEGRWAITGLGTGLFRITATKEGYQSVIIEKNVS